VTYGFAVDRVLKGAVSADASVRSVVSGASCGLEGMREGEIYTVFARTQDGALHSGLCSGTRAGGSDPTISAFAGALLPVQPGGPPLWVVLAGVASGALVAALIWRLRAWRRAFTTP